MPGVHKADFLAGDASPPGVQILPAGAARRRARQSSRIGCRLRHGPTIGADDASFVQQLHQRCRTPGSLPCRDCKCCSSCELSATSPRRSRRANSSMSQRAHDWPPFRRRRASTSHLSDCPIGFQPRQQSRRSLARSNFPSRLLRPSNPPPATQRGRAAVNMAPDRLASNPRRSAVQPSTARSVPEAPNPRRCRSDRSARLEGAPACHAIRLPARASPAVSSASSTCRMAASSLIFALGSVAASAGVRPPSRASFVCGHRWRTASRALLDEQSPDLVLGCVFG